MLSAQWFIMAAEVWARTGVEMGEDTTKDRCSVWACYRGGVALWTEDGISQGNLCFAEEIS